jgi:hypothetical protein
MINITLRIFVIAICTEVSKTYLDDHMAVNVTNSETNS